MPVRERRPHPYPPRPRRGGGPWPAAPAGIEARTVGGSRSGVGFNRQPGYSPFGFGTVGLRRCDYDVLGDDESRSTVGLGGGAGIELDRAAIVDDGNADASFPPLYSTTDLGFTAASFDACDWSAFTLRGGPCTPASDGSVTAADTRRRIYHRP